MVLLRRPRRNVLIGLVPLRISVAETINRVYLLNYEDARSAMSRGSSACWLQQQLPSPILLKARSSPSTDSVLEITVPGDHFMKITNFTQDGGTDRGVD